MKIALATAMALTATLVTALPAAAAPVPDSYTQQKLDWKPCFSTVPDGLPAGSDKLECAKVTAPLDWNNPGNGKNIAVAISRLKGKNAKNTLFTNPGGPGGEGRTLPLAMLRIHKDNLLDSHDVIGLDMRGTGGSSNVTCGAGAGVGQELDYRDRSEGNIDLLLDSTRLMGRYCQVKSGELGKFTNTEQVVKDYDLVRGLLGAEKVNYVGYSGGTWLGAYYATYFPNRVGRFVLDSNTDFTSPWQQTFDAQPESMQRRYRQDFAPWAAKYDDRFHQGTTAAAVEQNYERLRAELAKKPIQLAGNTFGPLELDYSIIGAMYDKGKFPATGELLNQLNGARSTDRIAELSTQLRRTGTTGPDGEIGTFFHILCNDTPWKGNEDDAVRKSGESGRKYPLAGYAKIRQPCLTWQRPALTMKKPDGKGVPPVLMVQADNDPATSNVVAEKAHRNFAGSRMLRVRNEGDHAIYAGGNPCVDSTVDAYLIDGKVPAGDLECQGVGLPAPDADGSNSLLATLAVVTAASGTLPQY
ncbi:alpha/beta hydrolase [Pseudonocardiaceae bacterium YIM PH 21723]|nr:alpha/beta hydrolase [Pseudonocardiaceae bacterium YIM PH 21723]